MRPAQLDLRRHNAAIRCARELAGEVHPTSEDDESSPDSGRAEITLRAEESELEPESKRHLDIGHE